MSDVHRWKRQDDRSAGLVRVSLFAERARTCWLVAGRKGAWRTRTVDSEGVTAEIETVRGCRRVAYAWKGADAGARALARCAEASGLQLSTAAGPGPCGFPALAAAPGPAPKCLAEIERFRQLLVEELPVWTDFGILFHETAQDVAAGCERRTAEERRERWGLSVDVHLDPGRPGSPWIERSLGGSGSVDMASVAGLRLPLDWAERRRPDAWTGSEADIVFLPRAAAMFLHECVGHALEGAGRWPIGRRVCPAPLQVVDDATIPGAFGTSVLDDLGRLTAPVPLVEDGVIVGRLDDRHAAVGRRQDFRHPTGPRMSNLVAASAPDEATTLCAEARNGLLVHRVAEGAFDRSSGWLTLLVLEAQVLDRGRPGRYLRPFGVEVCVDAALQRLVAVAGSAETLTTYCAAESGTIAVTGSAPACLVRGLTTRPLTDHEQAAAKP